MGGEQHTRLLLHLAQPLRDFLTRRIVKSRNTRTLKKWGRCQNVGDKTKEAKRYVVRGTRRREENGLSCILLVILYGQRRLDGFSFLGLEDCLKIWGYVMMDF